MNTPFKGKHLSLFGALMIVPIICTLIIYCVYSRDTATNIEEPIQAAYEADDVAKALIEIQKVVKYAEKEKLTTGKMRTWYFKLKKVEKKLEAANRENASKLEKENALLFLKVNLMKGDEVDLMEGISLHPYYNFYMPALILFSLLGVMGLVLLLE